MPIKRFVNCDLALLVKLIAPELALEEIRLAREVVFGLMHLPQTIILTKKILLQTRIIRCQHSLVRNLDLVASLLLRNDVLELFVRQACE